MRASAHEGETPRCHCEPVLTLAWQSEDRAIDCHVAAFLLRCPASACVDGVPWHLPTAATRFVKAQATRLHFPLAENSDCTLAFPLPTKQALWGPLFLIYNWRRSLRSPDAHLRFESDHTHKANGIPRWGIPLFGAADRTRTGTRLPSRDLKSLVSTYSTTTAYLIELCVIRPVGVPDVCPRL